MATRASDDPPAKWLPNAAQEDLLRAALLPDERAAAAWRRWRAQAGGPIDEGSRRLLPLAAANLTRLGAGHDDADDEEHTLARARAEHLRGRFRGVLVTNTTAEWATALAARGVPVMVLKGVALALRYYRDFGLRPMADIDLLVRPEHAEAALGYLHESGFVPTEVVPATCWPPGHDALARASLVHACGFVDARDRRVDVHWAALSTHCSGVHDVRFWARAEPLALGSAKALALCAADELVHVLAHGVRWNEVPSIRWVADAVVLLRHEGARFDWDTFVGEVEARGLAPAVQPALAHLLRYDVAVPEAVTRALARPVRWLDRLRLAHALQPWDAKKSLPVIAYDAYRFVEGLPAREGLTRLGSYVRMRLAPDGRWASVPAQLRAKLARTAWSKRGG